jgi:hypothetical protein
LGHDDIPILCNKCAGDKMQTHYIIDSLTGDQIIVPDDLWTPQLEARTLAIEIRDEMEAAIAFDGYPNIVGYSDLEKLDKIIHLLGG